MTHHLISCPIQGLNGSIFSADRMRPLLHATGFCAVLMLAACAGGGQSVFGGGPKGPGLGTTVGSGQATDGASRGDAPEGTPSRPGSLAFPDGGTFILGDTGMSSPPPDAVRTIDGIPVAILVPLTGRLAGPGKALLEGAQMALFDVGNPDFRLVPFDTGGTPLGAEQAAREAVNQGARLIIGPLLADSVAAVRPIAEAARIKVVAFSNSTRVAGGPVYLAGFTPEEQIDAIVANSMAEGRMRFAILAPSNDYGNVSVDALRASVSARGGEFSRVAFYDPESLDFADQIQRLSDYNQRVSALRQQRRLLEAQGDQAARQALKRLEVQDTWGDPPFDALVLPVLSLQTLQILSAQLAYYDVDQPAVRILGLQRWDEFPNLASEPGLVGSRYPAPRSAYRDQFEARYEALYGHAPTDLSALAYDVTAVAAALSGRVGGGSRFDTATLTDPQGFIGADGLFRFRQNGIVQRSFAIMEIQRSGTVVIQQAPDRFPPDPAEQPLS